MMHLMTVSNGRHRFSEPVLQDLGNELGEADWFWLDVDSVDDEVVEEIGRLFGLDGEGLDDVQNVSEFPKADDYEDHVFFSSHSPALVDDRVSTAELDGFVSERYLITFHRTPIPGVAWTHERLRQADSVASLKPGTLLAGILEAAARRSLQLVDGLEAQISELEARSIAGDPHVVGLVQAFRRDAIVLRRVLAPERDMVRALMHEGMPLGGALPGRLGLEIRLTVEGGLAVLAACRRRGNSFARPRLPRSGWPALLWRALLPTRRWSVGRSGDM